ncbi:uncharacterized protein ATC70_004799 [Mucor velutinosus]|uniref:Phosphatidate phosphatase APP1 catalytic domain-containing protein n=1 Tax=Mucor velutinosus TaxID=708070 RepID=A0AAN7D4W0_9FUNG|nr:hypothetical protein ATC70_004799 [Mucor velutinosus]
MHKPSLKHYHLPTKSSLSTATASSKSCNSSQLPLSIDTTTHAVHRECILFPTYAFRDPSNIDQWIVRTKGWALSMKKPGPKQRVLKGITKSVAGKGSATHEHANKMFESRFKYFMAKGKRNKRIQVEAIGAATNAEWIQLGNNPSLQSPLTPPPSSSSTPHNNLEDVQLQKQTSLQWQKIYDATKKYADSPATVIHNHDDNDVNPPPIFLDTPHAPTSMASNTDHQISSDEDDDEEGDSSCDEMASPLSENGTILKSAGAGVFQGEFCISGQQVEKWIRDSNHASSEEQDEERMIKIRSCSKRDGHHTTTKKDFFFPPSYGIVQLIEPYGVSVISDIDDTIKDTRILSGARTVLSNTFFNPTRAIPGMADAYLQWYNQGASYHYVSNSPFQLVHMLHQFINSHHFPPGSFHLRPSTGIISKLVQESGRSKRESICKILRDFPHRKFVLVGDSGEIDLEIYTRIAADFPGQIIKIFIRDITTHQHHHYPTTQEQKQRRINNKRSATLPAFFSSNFASSHKTESTPNLSSTIHQDDQRIPNTDYDDDEDNDEEDEELQDTATKLAELVLEPSLTGHQPLHMETHLQTAAAADEDLPEGLQQQHYHQHQQPPSQSLIQLFSRLAIARRLVKGIDVVLFKESKELYQDEQVKLALARYKNSKQKQY